MGYILDNKNYGQLLVFVIWEMPLLSGLGISVTKVTLFSKTAQYSIFIFNNFLETSYFFEWGL
ncbi:hypothetical protein CXF59_05595 [Flavobacterium sp. ALD4]|nr:hypothetical protein CXF59_05595 [Flavobacterium sp. ALD4]